MLERLGYYSPEALYVEDYDLWIRAAELTGVANIPEVLVEYRVTENSVSGRNVAKQEENANRLKRELIARFVPRISDMVRLRRAYIAKIRPGRKQRAEIALDVIRRTGIGFGSLKLLPDLCTFHTFKMVFSVGTWFVLHRDRVSGRQR